MNEEISERAEDSVEPAVANEYVESGREKQWRELQALTARKARRKNTAIGMVAGMAAIGILIVAANIFASVMGELNARRMREKARLQLYEAVTNAVSAQLKAPRGAVFCRPEELVEKVNGNFTAAGWVDSQNGFGAMIRTPFKAEYDHLYLPHEHYVVRWVIFEK